MSDARNGLKDVDQFRKALHEYEIALGDSFDWLKSGHEETIGELERACRQLERAYVRAREYLTFRAMPSFQGIRNAADLDLERRNIELIAGTRGLGRHVVGDLVRDVIRTHLRTDYMIIDAVRTTLMSEALEEEVTQITRSPQLPSLLEINITSQYRDFRDRHWHGSVREFKEDLGNLLQKQGYSGKRLETALTRLKPHTIYRAIHKSIKAGELPIEYEPKKKKKPTMIGSIDSYEAKQEQRGKGLPDPRTEALRSHLRDPISDE